MDREEGSQGEGHAAGRGETEEQGDGGVQERYEEQSLLPEDVVRIISRQAFCPQGMSLVTTFVSHCLVLRKSWLQKKKYKF